MRRALPLMIAAMVLAGCGQIHGVHQRFLADYARTVAASTNAHGESAKTRTGQAPARPAPARNERIPGGTRILKVVTSTRAGTMTWPQWAALLLDHLDAPRCANNLIVVVAWEQQEGTSAGWNPLATTFSMPGATTYNSAGVRNYPSLESGLQATLLTLQNGALLHGYGAIVQDLKACADPVATARAINASDWCRGCSGGEYVLGVLPAVIAAYVGSLRPGK